MGGRAAGAGGLAGKVGAGIKKTLHDKDKMKGIAGDLREMSGLTMDGQAPEASGFAPMDMGGGAELVNGDPMAAASRPANALYMRALQRGLFDRLAGGGGY